MNKEMASVATLDHGIETNDNQTRIIKVNGGLCYRFFKRAFDIFASGAFLLVFGWFILLLMLIKWLEDFGGKAYKLEIIEDENGKYLSKNGKRYNCIVSKDKNGKKDPTVHGPIYSSDRVGKNGKVFKFHKIRSMCPGAEAMKKELLKYGINEADDPVFKLAEDPRITRFGRFLRKTSMDELPQIWDVFVGKQSVVGPRSPIPLEYSEYNEYQKQRLLGKGGLICTWQISKNRNHITFDEWVDMDIKYLETRTFFGDIALIFKAVFFVLFDRSGE